MAQSAGLASAHVLWRMDLMTIALIAAGILVSLAIAASVLLAVFRNFWRPRMPARKLALC